MELPGIDGVTQAGRERCAQACRGYGPMSEIGILVVLQALVICDLRWSEGGGVAANEFCYRYESECGAKSDTLV